MEQTCNDSGTNNTPLAKNLLSVRQLASKHQAFSENSVRALIFASKARKRSASKNGLADIPGNGLAQSIIKLGRRVLIDEHAFLEWVNSHSGALASKVGLQNDLPRDSCAVQKSPKQTTS